MANLANGGKPFHYMTREECLEHGKKHSKTYNKKTNQWFDSSPWIKDEEAMCLKTVLTQGAKIWPISIELQRALDTDETSRSLVPGVQDALDIPSQTDWDAVEKETEKIIEKELDK
jgi:recombination protein RecT